METIKREPKLMLRQLVWIWQSTSLPYPMAISERGYPNRPVYPVLTGPEFTWVLPPSASGTLQLREL